MAAGRPEVVGQGLTYAGSKTGTQLIRQRRVKKTARVVATSNVTISTLGDGDTVDGVTIVEDDRIFLQGQTLGEENGMYDAGPAGGPSARSADFDNDSEVTAGVEVFVSEGTAKADTSWVLITDDPIVVGTTALVFVEQPVAPHTHSKADLPAAIAYEDELNIFTLKQRFEDDLELDDQSGSPVADRRMRVIDGFLRVTDISQVEGRNLSRLSVELFTNAEIAAAAAIAESKLALNFPTHDNVTLAHDFAGAEHTADAFADLLTKITDRGLIGLIPPGTNNLQAFHDALPAGGGLMYLDKGTFVITSLLALSKTDVAIIGSGPATILEIDGTTLTAITSSGNNLTLQNLSIHYKSTADESTKALSITAGVGINLRNLWFDNFATSGGDKNDEFVTISGGSHIVFDSCHFRATGGHIEGAIRSSVATDISFSSCHAHDAELALTISSGGNVKIIGGTWAAVVILGASASNIKLLGMDLTGTTTAVSSAATAVQILGCHCKGNNQGISISGADSKVIGCDFKSITTEGVVVQGDDISVDHCTFDLCSPGIVVKGTAQRPKLTNLTITGNAGKTGIDVQSPTGDGGRISNCTITACDKPIIMSDGDDWVLNDLHLLNINAGTSPIGVGVHLTGTAVKRIQIRDCHMEPNKEGILDESDNGLHTFQDNEIRGGTKAIFVDSGFDGDGIVIKGNKLIAQSDSGIRIFFDADGPIVTENIIRDSTGATQMILCKRNSVGDSKLQINDNHIASCASATRCIQVDAANNAQVNDNRIANNGGDGVGLISSDDCSVSHNHITDQTGDGINLTADSNDNEIIGNVFKAITGTNLVILGTGCKTDLSLNPLNFMAGDFDGVSASDFPVNTLAAAQADENDNSMTVRAMPDSTESGFSFRINIPVDAQRLKIAGQIRQDDASPAAGDVRLSWYERRIESNPTAFPSAGSPNVDLDVVTLAANEIWVNFEREFSLSALGMAKDQRHQIEFTRRPASGGDTLGKDVRLERLELTFI